MASKNCVASTSIGCIFCCLGCNASKLRNAFTFIPPPKSYEIKDGKIIYELEARRRHPAYQAAAEHAQVHMVKTGTGERIPALWLSRKKSDGEHIQEDLHPSPRPSTRSGSDEGSPRGLPNAACMPSCLMCREPQGTGELPALLDIPVQRLLLESEEQVDAKPFVLLHCHGNATDIGLMMGPYWELSKQLGVDVVGVEYSGYGQASGSPSPAGALLDVEAVYDYVVQSGVAPHRIIAYGQSVGCGPTVALACRRTLGGVVLHSPMLSGIRVIDPAPDSCCKPSCMYSCFDFFKNEEAMPHIECPVFVIHGKEDTIVPFYHGLRLFEASPEENRWPGYFPEHAGHNDIIERDTDTFFSKLRAFMNSIKDDSAIFGGLPKAPPVQAQMREDRESTAETDDLALPSGNAVSEPIAFHEPMAGPCHNIYDEMRHNNLKVRRHLKL